MCDDGIDGCDGLDWEAWALIHAIAEDISEDEKELNRLENSEFEDDEDEW